MSKKEIEASIAELEERIELQILTLQVIREHLNDLMVRLDKLKKDSV